jgi:L-alanine-DL-glutamate epimerase-like enolase superfamily enzyme
MSYYYLFEKHQLRPEGGRIRLPDRPGFGIELDESRIEKRTLVQWS